MFQEFLPFENQSMQKVDQKCVDPIECGFFEVWNFKTFWISFAKTAPVCFKDFWLLKSIHGKSRSNMCWSFDFGFWILDFGVWNFVSCFLTLDLGVWTFEFWILDLGFWVSGKIKKATILPQPPTTSLVFLFFVGRKKILVMMAYAWKLLGQPFSQVYAWGV